MVCDIPIPLYANPQLRGLLAAASAGDGYTVHLRWAQAVSDRPSLQVIYNIYYSTFPEHVFSEGVKFVSIDPNQTTTTITDLIPGETYFFAVRAALSDTTVNNLFQLPIAPNGLRIYPEAALLADITDTDLIIPVSDVDIFPAMGVVQIGAELIWYTSIDLLAGELLVAVNGRGFYGTIARLHTPDGYDGYRTYDNPLVRFFSGFSDQNHAVVMEENKFNFPHFAWTNIDGYKEVFSDILTTDLSASDTAQADFPPFDFSGWRRTDPVDLLAGKCVGSYYGGEWFCADGYSGIGRRIRGLSISDINNSREETLLSTDGEPVVLIKRMWTGKRCPCFENSKESPESRCPFCFGTGFLTGYDQFYNHRRSDSRIMVRFDPAVDDLIPQDSGLESDFRPNAWTLVYPAIKDRDFLIRFNLDGTEEFRYEVLNVTRNKILLNNFGAQKMTLARIRKTDIIYQWRAIRDTSTMPMVLTTGIGMASNIPPHVHEIHVDEHIVSLSQINETTSVVYGHNHPVVNGVVSEVLGHTHNIIYP